jgi:hypothetical protein
MHIMKYVIIANQKAQDIKMDKILAIGLICIFFVVGAAVGSIQGFERGKVIAYESIILEECWLNNQTRDIICVEYIGE